jgi:hypothetical protein
MIVKQKVPRQPRRSWCLPTSIEKGLLSGHVKLLWSCHMWLSSQGISRLRRPQRKVDGCVVTASVEDVNGIYHIEKRFTCQLVQEQNYTCSKSVCERE